MNHRTQVVSATMRAQTLTNASVLHQQSTEIRFWSAVRLGEGGDWWILAAPKPQAHADQFNLSRFLPLGFPFFLCCLQRWCSFAGACFCNLTCLSELTLAPSLSGIIALQLWEFLCFPAEDKFILPVLSWARLRFLALPNRPSSTTIQPFFAFRWCTCRIINTRLYPLISHPAVKFVLDEVRPSICQRELFTVWLSEYIKVHSIPAAYEIL